MATFSQLHKFGGSSLANPECYQRVVNILREYSSTTDLVVVYEYSLRMLTTRW